MNLFGKKRAATENLRTAQDRVADLQPHPAATHRVTLDLSRAKDLAAMLASSRASKFIEIPDLLAGLYMYGWDRLAVYWPEENRDHVEEFFRDMCRISPQRWNYWITGYDARMKEGEVRPRWERFRKRKEVREVTRQEAAPTPSASLRAVFEAAEWVSPFRDPNDGAPDENGVPVLTSECLLLCIAKYIASDTGRKLVESGLDVNELVRAVLDPKRAPLR